MDLSFLTPSRSRLVNLRKNALIAPVGHLGRQSSRFPIPLSIPSLIALCWTLFDFASFAVEMFIAGEMVAMLAISSAWICKPGLELRLRAGLPAPPWVHSWMLKFKLLHWLCINFVYWKYGDTTRMVPIRCALALWGLAIVLVATFVTGYIAKSMLQNAWDDMRWPVSKVKHQSEHSISREAGDGILRGQGVMQTPRHGSKMKRE